MRLNKGVMYRYGEVAPDNTTMIRQLEGNETLIGGADSAVLEFKRLPNNLMDSFPMNVEIIPIIRYGIKDKDNFIAVCQEDGIDDRYVVTNSIATGGGSPRTDIRPQRLGKKPPQIITECVIDSSLLAIKREAERREWGNEQKQEYPVPVRRLLESRPDIARVLYPSDGNNIIIGGADRSSKIEKPMPEAHVYVHNDKDMVDGIYAAGAERRVLGLKPTKPTVNILSLG
jgi:hypothetical protein